MNSMNCKTFVCIAFATLLIVGCKATEIETSIKSFELRDAIEGKELSLKFDAQFTIFAENNEETKRQIVSIEGITEKYLPLEEFDVTTTDFGLRIQVEGKIPLVYSSEGTLSSSLQAPWVLIVSDNNDGGVLTGFSHKLKFIASPQFNAFSGELLKVNLMLVPDKRQPLKIKFKNSGKDRLRIFTGAVEVGGESRVIFESKIDKKVSLTMKGGVYDNIAQVIYFSIE